MSFGVQFALFFALVYASTVSASIEQHHADHLSTHPHYQGGEHDPGYDHDAFLGPKQAKEFETLSEGEAKKRLRAMIPKLDTDKDGEISQAELEDWIDKQRKNFMYDAVDEDIEEHDQDGDKMISWNEYMKARFGESENEDFPKDEVLKDQIRKSRRKFDAADQDKDGKMSREEFVLFQHPEEAEYMEKIAIEEIVDEVDKDGDGLISIKEFLGQYGENQGPEWVQKERENFARTFDTNGNGKLEFDEIHKWVIPMRGESREEAEHLMEGTDEDADGYLSVDEIILHYDLFVGSKATDHGETLKRMRHDEF